MKKSKDTSVKKPEKLSEAQIKKILDDQKKPPMVTVASTREIKLKDREGKNSITIKLVESFGFVPSEITVKKVPGKNNMIVVSTIVPQSILDEEKKKKGGNKK